ncbi:MAG: leucine-rich repeat domain-containing protein [Treponema sp.]|jgi:hypothetical protein|nr:leucine-rich repeat domain-containing protein [Treponema sp.]
MSDERLEGARKGLLWNSIFFCVGWVPTMIGFLTTYTSWGMWVLGIGWGILGGPRLLKAAIGGFGAALKPDYEVVTMRGGIAVSSDGGAQSMMTGFVGRLFMIVIFYIVGGFVSLIHMVILTIRYIVLHISTSPKPAFIKSGMFIIVINAAVLIGGFLLGGVVQKAERAAFNAGRGLKTSGDYNYIVNETKDGVILEEYLGSKGGDIVIPATIAGLPVVRIEAALLFSEFSNPPHGAKENRKDRITSVVIPDTVTYINGGFEGCADLKQVTLPKNLKYIQTEAFKKSGLTSIVIPEGVTDIGNRVFADCKNLTSVTLPRSLERIGSSVFEGCTSLVDVKIPSGSTIMYGDYASGGSQDHSLYIEGMDPHGHFRDDHSYEIMVALNKRAFKGCTNLSAASKQTITDSGYEGEF